ncbi:sugar ABC transporter substrate-binding protein [Paramicrobacterium chengjingii]|uniref:sugar ABC transporter substrate-binding protein n=1 Tax=Paramicrobacterium chengjingii TaxID=2769067 RepID=UPI00142014CE|nr:ABC transporter substrate-binding protein [Microbacterium chengjingii]
MAASNGFLRAANDIRLSRRGLMGLSGAAAATAMLAGCSSPSGSRTSGGSAADELTIMTSGIDAEGLEFMQKYAGDPLGLKLKLVTVKDETYAAQAASAQQAGKSPDIVQWTAEGMSYLMASGVDLAPLDDYSADLDRSDLYEQDFASGSLEGKLYALAYGVNCRAIVYRTDYLGSNTTPEEWNSDEFGEWATSLIGSGRNAFGWEAKTGDGRGSSNFLPLLWSAGGNTVTGDPGSFKIGFTKSQIETVMNFYSDMIYKYRVAPSDVGGWGYEDTDGGFSKGTLGAYSVGPFIRSIAAKYPDTVNNLGVAPLPNLGTPTTFWESSALMIHNQSNKKDKAWAFIEKLRGEEFQTDVVIGRGGLGVLKSLNTNIKDEFIAPFGRLIETAGLSAPVSAQPFMNNLFYPAMQEVALRNTSPADAAQTVMDKADSVLAEVNA